MSFGEQVPPRPVLAIEGGPFFDDAVRRAAGEEAFVTHCGEGGVFRHGVARLGSPVPFDVALCGLAGRRAAGGGGGGTDSRGGGWIQPAERAKGGWSQVGGREGSTHG